jgi:YHS domain-containing protein
MSIKRRSLVLAAAAAAVVAAGAGAWYATHAGPAAQHGKVFAENGLAIRGYDPVAYFTDGRPVEGRPEFAATLDGATWRFASAEHKAAFEADPAKFTPQYGGYCAWAVSAKNEAYPIDPNAWKIVDGKLYLNYSQDVQKDWGQDVPGHIAKADKNWPGLERHLAGG